MLSRLVRPTALTFGQIVQQQSASALPQQMNAGAAVMLARPLFTSKAVAMPYKEGSERDVTNFPRPKRAMYAGKVRFGFVPDEWFTFFYNKTGVTGPYAFGAGFLTYLLSKEIWVLEHEFWGGVSFFIMIIYGVNKLGPKVSAWLNKEQQNVIDDLNSGKINDIKSHNDAISAEKRAQLEAEGSKMLFEVKRENVGLQLEASYRQRIMEVYQEVKRRLDYQVEKQNVERAIQQKHMVNWIIESVRKSVSAESDAENLKKCIADLKGIAARQ